MEQQIEDMQPSYRLGSVIFLTEPLKFALITETKAWKLAYAKALNDKCGREMVEILDFIDNLSKRLARPVKDLDDVRSHMAALSDIREAEIKMDMSISPIEETYSLLNRYNLVVNDGNAEKVDSLSYGWTKLVNQVTSETIMCIC